MRKGSRRRVAAASVIGADNFHDYLDEDAPARRRTAKARIGTDTLTVTDDWPERVPVTEAEIDVFEAWFGDLLDELFGPEL